MSNLSSLCKELGVPLAVENTIGPSCVITFLGLQIDTLEMVIKIPPPKLSEVQQKLIETLKKKKITLNDLMTHEGPMVFSTAKGTPNSLHRELKFDIKFVHSLESARPANKKSSK
jgi:hypothetical protein